MSQNGRPPLFRPGEVAGLTVLLLVFYAGVVNFAVITSLRHAEDNFRQRAHVMARDVNHQISSAEAVLTSLVGLHHASDGVKPHEFHALARELLHSYEFIRSVAEITIVDRDHVDVFEEGMQAKGYFRFAVTERSPDGTMIPASARDVVMPIVSLAPMDPEFAWLVGYDASSDPVLAEALSSAIKSGKAVASNFVELPHVGSGVFALKATYLGYVAPRNAAARRSQANGAVALFLDGARFFDGIDHSFERVTVRLAGSADSHGRSGPVLFESRQPPLSPTVRFFGPFEHVLPIDVMGRTMLVDVSGRPLLRDIRGWFIVLLLAMPAVACAFLVLALVSHRRARRQAAEDERKLWESRQRFQDYAEIASDWYWAMKSDLRFSYVSEQFSVATGIPASRILGRTREEMFYSVDRGPQVQAHVDDLAARRPFKDFRYRLRKMDGSSLWCSVSGKPIYEDGKFAGYRGIGRDITAEVRAERTIVDAKEEAELASRAKSEFLANMSHELRTPLNAIIGFSEMLKMRFDEAGDERKNHGYADNIHAAGKHLLGIINDILDLSKIESGKSSLDEQEVDLADVIGSVRALIAERARDADVTVTYRIDGPLPTLWGDSRKLRQILINLLSNAVKFTPAGGIVSVTVEDMPDGGCRLVVADSGIGIAKKNIPIVLAAFQQVDGELNRKYDGSGLGLPLAKAFAEQHGGSLLLESGLDAGTIATVILPPERVLGFSNSDGSVARPAGDTVA